MSGSGHPVPDDRGDGAAGLPGLTEPDRFVQHTVLQPMIETGHLLAVVTDARAQLDGGVVAAESIGRVQVLAALAGALHELGDDAASGHAEEAYSIALRLGWPDYVAVAAAPVALARGAVGDRAGAREVLTALSVREEMGDTPEYAPRLPALVRSAVAIADPDLGAVLAARVQPGLPVREHALVTARALLDEARGEHEQAATGFVEAAQRWGGFGNRLKQAYATLGAGRCRLGSDPAAGRAAVDEARQLFSAMAAHAPRPSANGSCAECLHDRPDTDGRGGGRIAPVLHVRVVTPKDRSGRVVARLEDDATVANLVVLTGVARQCGPEGGDLVMFDLARENANPVLDDLRELDLERDGSIAFDEAETVMSQAAVRAEQAAPGRPADGVIWDAVEARVADDARLSWSFVTFLVLATLIAGTGRYLDQPILIVGAMVVGPEFAPVAAICFGLATRSWYLLRPAAVTLAVGFGVAAAIATVVWALAYFAGLISQQQAATGPDTQFIVQPDGWSLVVALLAGSAGVLSMTASKSGVLVGVFISVTTVPAVGTVALTLATGVWHEVGSALLQLGINLAGILLSGTVTLVVQKAIWDRVLPHQRQGHHDESGQHAATG